MQSSNADWISMVKSLHDLCIYRYVTSEIVIDHITCIYVAYVKCKASVCDSLLHWGGGVEEEGNTDKVLPSI